MTYFILKLVATGYSEIISWWPITLIVNEINYCMYMVGQNFKFNNVNGILTAVPPSAGPIKNEKVQQHLFKIV